MNNTRLLSLDALRGFDMLFIMGFSELIINLCQLFPSELSIKLVHHMHHVSWDGLTHHDTIFPLFLFLAGVSFPFSLSKQKSQGISSLQIHQKILKRGIMLIFLGCIYNGLLQFDFAHMRYASVLGRIGLAWMFAALITIHTNSKTRISILFSILVGYWILLYFFPAPDTPSLSPFSRGGNLAGYIDRHFLPGVLHGQNFDPEGILSTLPAIGTALLGIFAGELIQSNQTRYTPLRKSLILALCGILLLSIGLYWNKAFPINKNLWSSSFVCVVGGYSYLIFSLFYYLIDVKGWHSWTFPLRVIGMNSITIYLAQEIINFNQINEFFLGGTISLFNKTISPVIYNIGYITVCWLFLWFLYKKQIFLKV